MKKLWIVACLLITQAVLAADYRFDCSSADGEVRITNQGQDLIVSGATFIPGYAVKDFVPEFPQSDSKITARVESINERTILSRYEDHTCRDVLKITYAQEVSILPANGSSFKKITVTLLCRELSVSSPNHLCGP